MTSTHDEKLVRRAQKGNQAAFAELFARYEGRIFGYLYRMVGDRAWAEDLAQEAFIQAHQNLGRLGPPYDFKSWVYRIAGNLALDGLRRYRDTVALPDWDGGEATAPEPSDQRREGDPEDQAGLAEVRDAVWRTIHQLPDNYRQVLILREIDGLSYNEIAGVLGISLDNVRVTLHRARLQFRDLYGIQVMVTEGRLACQELDDLLLSAYVDGELDRAGRKRVKTHIETCPVCQKKRRDLLAIGGLLAAVAPVFPPPSLQARFLTRLRHLPPPETPPAGGSGGHPSGRGGGFFEGGSPPWMLMILGGGGAILLIAAAVLGLLMILPYLGPYLGISVPPTDTPIPPPPSLTPTAPPTSAPVATSAPLSPPPTPTPTPTPTSTPVPPTPTPIPPTSTPIPPTAPPPPPPTLTPPPTPTSPPTPIPSIAFWAEANVVPAGTCTTVRWQTAHVQAVFFNGQGVPGIGSHQTCPCANETHTLDVTLPDGSHDVRYITIQVNGSCITPTPDIQGPPAPVPGYPTGNTVLSCRASATLSWKAVSDPSGVAGYHVRLEKRLQNETWGSVGEWGPLPGTQRDVPVSCGLLYRWAVRAEDGLGNLGPWSRWIQFGIGID